MGLICTAVATLHTVECSCGGVYAISETSYQEHSLQGTCWACPYCRCSWGFSGRGDKARLERELEQVRNTLASERARHDQTREALRHTERSRAAVSGHLRRTKTRISRGVCPCCNRTFANIARHMETKHVGYVEENKP